jgi:hypothetical protein
LINSNKLRSLAGSGARCYPRHQSIVGLEGAYAPADTPLHGNAELTLVTPMEGG